MLFAQAQIPIALSPWHVFLGFVGGVAMTELVKRILFKDKEDVSAEMQLEMRKAMNEIISQTIAPILNTWTEILRNHASFNQGIERSLAELTSIERNRQL
jgi:hypothetical protein